MGAPLDIVAGILIFINTLVLFLQLQWQGYEARVVLKLEEPGGWQGADLTFEALEYIFTCLFLGEMMIRIGYNGVAFLKDFLNVLDAFVVLVTTLDTFVLSQVGGFQSGGIVVARMIRYVKLVKTLRFVRAMKLCSCLRVLIQTIMSSVMSLVWSMIILFVFMLMAAIFTCQTLQGFLIDESNNFHDRLWVEERYGSAAKALWTMFEITFSGGWPNWVTPLVTKVSIWYAFFFAFYVTGVVFAVIRIITALFLRDTLAVAAKDTQMQMVQKAAEKAKTIAKLEQFFEECDTSHGGLLSYEEFQVVLELEGARDYFQSLELEIHEMDQLFNLLDDGDGQVSFNEFLAGLLRIKGQARETDVLAVLHDSRKILGLCQAMSLWLEHMQFDVMSNRINESNIINSTDVSMHDVSMATVGSC